MPDIVTAINNDIVNFLKINNFSIKSSPGDSHCFLYSIKTGLRYQLGINLELSAIKSHLQAEITQHVCRYEHFLTSGRNHLHDMSNYINHKKYNTSVCDLLPQILSNSLGINIRIIDQHINSNSYNDILIYSLRPAVSTVTLHKKSDHYNAIIPTPV